MNRALWQDKLGEPGVVRRGPISSNIRDDEILVRVHAWGLNPADHMLQDMQLPFAAYPLILGEDVAGTVEYVGSVASSKLENGDRVCAVALGAASQRPEEGCFQDYVVHNYTLATKIPDSISFVEAAVFPLCVATAGHGLFAKDLLGLPFPKLNPTNSGKSVFVWGGSSGVGSNAIQLCKFAGFEVVTTCSARNFDYVKGLGAAKAFDYSSPSVVDDVAAELDKGICAGIYHAVGPVKTSCQISAKSNQKLLVASTNPIDPNDVPDGVEAKVFAETGGNIWGSTCEATFGGFLTEALAKGLYKVAPSPDTINTRGVEGIQEGIDLLRKGVSAKKIVVVNDLTVNQ